jgi:hypothetical protein
MRRTIRSITSWTEGAYRTKPFLFIFFFVKIKGMDIFTIFVKPVAASVTLYAWEAQTWFGNDK